MKVFPSPESEAAYPSEPDKPLYIRSDGSSFVYPYPNLNGEITYYSYQIGKQADRNTAKIVAYLFIVKITRNDPRESDFKETSEDSSTIIPMTESSLYGLMDLLSTMRADMVPETAAMLSTVFDSGHFNQH